MKKGNTYTGYVEYVDFPNKAYVSAQVEEDGVKSVETAVVKNAIPGQTVSFMVNKKKHGKCEGRLLEVVKQADCESNERCPHFGLCGGCVYQTVSYDNQLKMKEKQVHKLLSSVIEGDFCFEGITGSPVSEEYRNKMEFTFGDEYKDGPLSLGLHKRNSMYDIVSVLDCKIVDEDYRKILECVLEYAVQEKLKFHHRVTHEGYLRHLLVRKAVKTGQILVDIITTTEDDRKFNDLSEKMQKLELKGELVGFLHTFNDSLADAVINQGTEVVYGRDYIEEELLGLTFKITPFSFFQTNSLGAEVLYSKVRDYVGLKKEDLDDNSKPVIFDLYSGTGTIAQILAPVAKKVIGVEIVPEAVEAAKINAKLNGLDNCYFIADDVLKALDNIEEKPDFIVLDPPRDGINPKALDKIIAYGVERMVYISCKPTSLIRDLEILQSRGYTVEKSCCVDMFPNTVHVETVVLLTHLKEPDDFLRIHVDLDELDITKSETKATYNKVRSYVKDKYDLHVPNLYIAQVKRDFGIIERENYNLGDGKARVPKCPKEKYDAIVDALKHFNMIA
ncbi:MAG: 23S rRNA (uracil(1939)-C(5))-methyltransferase RlmD [Lachnospira sp.]